MNFATGPSGHAVDAALAGVVTEAAFEELCRRHDLTFSYSEGPSYWRGKESLKRIQEAAKSLPPDVAARVWNRIVDLKIVEGQREEWYWTVERDA